jgi:transcriptional regulator with AAA-type ATPase domain
LAVQFRWVCYDAVVPIPPDGDVTERVPEGEAHRILSIGLVVVDGPSRGKRITLNEGIARAGAAPGNQLRLQDPTVSRVHCEIRVRPDGVVVRDCGSKNGTFVEGVRLKEGEVRPGAVVRLGASAFRIEEVGGGVFLPVSDRTSFGECVGASFEMRRLYAVLERVAPTTSTVLVEGETGTGKDVVARSIHAASQRADGPFVPIDCGAIPETLIESELFGHVRGAFSGAQSDRRGVFEEAQGGTLFLDEIGELPLQVQPKLLRAIESRTVRRVGSNTERPIDVRIIAATNRSLVRCVNEGTFREDLYYRLAVVDVTLPPLRARRDDVATLACYFHERLGGVGTPSPQFLTMLAARGWPGNVRELRNHIERSISLGLEVGGAPGLPSGLRPETIPAPFLEQLVPLHLPLKDARLAWTESFENIYVRSMLRKTGGRLNRAAELAGVNRRFMQRLMSRLGIKPGELGVDPRELDDDSPSGSGTTPSR